jgi:hypothetical protein
VIVDDFDDDADLDIVTSTIDPAGQLHYFRQEGDGTFTDRTREAGLLGLLGGLNMVQADYDNDGHLDFYVIRGAWLGAAGRYPDSLVRNRGGGVFTDVTFDAGLENEHWPSQTAAWADYDQDGDLDLYVGNESRPDAPLPVPAPAPGRRQIHRRRRPGGRRELPLHQGRGVGRLRRRPLAGSLRLRTSARRTASTAIAATAPSPTWRRSSE